MRPGPALSGLEGGVELLISELKNCTLVLNELESVHTVSGQLPTD